VYNIVVAGAISIASSRLSIDLGCVSSLSASARDMAGCRSKQKRGAHGCQEKDEIRTEGQSRGED